MQFSIGQEVICIKTHSQSHINGVVKGNTYVVTGVYTSKCKCKKQEITLGILKNYHSNECPYCKEVYPYIGLEWLFYTHIFIPVDYTKAKRVEFSKIVEEIPIYTN